MKVLVRIAQPELGELLSLLTSRYPGKEWATFAKFGWRDTPRGLVITLADLSPPIRGDLDQSAAHVVIREPYTLRVALDSEKGKLAVGVVHSHPQGYLTFPSTIDDDMDGYYAEYFSGFTGGRPYVSLILARDRSGTLSGTGRVYWKGEWHVVERFVLEGKDITVGDYHHPQRLSAAARARVARLESAFGLEAAERLARATVAVIGAGGTGSPAIEVLARAGVGRIITVDPDILTDSNLERVHGSVIEDPAAALPKVVIAKRHAGTVADGCELTAIRGALPQQEAVDEVIWADALVGCTDQEHSRLAISDLAARFLVPAIDCGVALEGEDGEVSGQVLQLVRFLAADPCARCRKLVDQRILNQELMSEEERAQRQRAAEAAVARGEAGDPYWQDVPQLNTVGYLTTAAGALAAGYVIGWLTRRFDPPFTGLQCNFGAKFWDVTDEDTQPRPGCICRQVRGWADQGAIDAFIHPPTHWPPAELV